LLNKLLTRTGLSVFESVKDSNSLPYINTAYYAASIGTEVYRTGTTGAGWVIWKQVRIVHANLLLPVHTVLEFRARYANVT
jgi:hypothetical protein